MPAKPPVSVRRIHAEPADAHSAAIGEIAWLALWETGSVSRHDTARALLRVVRRRDRRDAARAERQGRAAAIFVTVITWHDTPPGFVPPTSEEK